MSEVKVSIVIPTYNVENYIEDTLQGVCNQTLKDIEIICIDDFSTDNTLEILKQMTIRDTRINVIGLKENVGPGVARNIAIETARGEYLMFLDADDWLVQNACEIAYKHIKLNNNDFSCFNYYKYFEKKQQLKLIENSENLLKDGVVWRHIYNTNFIKNNNIKFGQGRISEDNVFFIKANLLSKHNTAISEPLYYYRVRGDNSSITGNSKYCFDAINSKIECYELVKKYANENLLNSGLAYCINTSLFVYKAFMPKIKTLNKRKLFYKKLKTFFIELDNEIYFDFELKKIISYHEFKKILKYNFFQYNIINFFEKILSIYKEKNRIKLSIMGIKFNIKYNYE